MMAITTRSDRAKARGVGTSRIDRAQTRAPRGLGASTPFVLRFSTRFRCNPDIKSQVREILFARAQFSFSRERSEIKRFRINAFFGLACHFRALLGTRTRSNQRGARYRPFPQVRRPAAVG